MSLVNYKRRAEAVRFEDEVFEKLDLRSMKAFGSSWKDCSFRDCQFDLTDWRNSTFDGCTFLRCSLPLVNFSTCVFERTTFTKCNLEQASFMGSHFTGVTFAGCRMAYGDTMFQDATCKGDGLRFLDSNLHGSNLDFRQAERESLQFDGCNLWAAKLSMGCQFWNGTFDDRTVRQFLALVARAAQDPRIAELAGDQYAVVCRAMDGVKGGTHERETRTPTMKPVMETRTSP